MARPTQVIAVAPAKLILMGEHAAVYGRPALVTTLGLFTRVELEAGKSSGIHLDLATLGVRRRTTWSEILSYASERRAAWRRYASKPSPERFRPVAGDDPAHLVKIALGETARALGLGPEGMPGIAASVSSEIPVGSGLGSSASVAVAVIAALCQALGRELEPRALSSVALEVERRQHGLPSGVDHTAVLHGGVLEIRKTPTGGEDGGDSVEVTPIVRGDATPALAALRVFDTGRPSQTTGEVVAAVADRRERDREKFELILDDMEQATKEFRARLTARGDGMSDLGEPIRRFQRCLDEIGVVPNAVRESVRKIEHAGGSAKLSGAGGLGRRKAGALLVYRPPALSKASLQDATAAYRPYEALLGVGGLRIESGSKERAAG